MSQVSQSSQLRYISNGPLDAKAYVSSKEELSGFTSAEKYVGMTVIVGNEKTTKIPEEYWLVGGIGKNKWLKKAPNFQLKIDEESGELSLVLEEGAATGSASSVNIKEFIADLSGDVFVKGGTLITKQVDGKPEAFIRLYYSDDAMTPVDINVTGLISGGIDLDDYYTKEESDEKFFWKIEDSNNNSLEYRNNGLGIHIYGNDVEL